MKVRKLAVAMALVGGLGSGVANALGLGDAELKSFLNEPLNAEIDLREANGVSPDQVIVELPSQDVFRRVGVERSFFLNSLNFSVTTAPNGQLVIDVTSDRPVREPYLNFLIEVSWPNGRLLREYSLLIDPPTYAERSGVQEPVQPAQTETREPESRSAESIRREREIRGEVSRGTDRESASSRLGGEYGPTDSSDTLWSIAQSVRSGTDYTTQQVMMALLDQNPNAFIGGNINRLKRGEVLRIPTGDQIARRSPGEASRDVVAQNEALKQPEPEIDATAQQPEEAPAAEPAGEEAELRLVTADGDSSEPGTTGESATGGGESAAGAEDSPAVAQEELDRLRRSNDELKDRMSDLEQQVDTLQRLLELKNSQLAAIQQGQATEGEEPGVESEDSVSSEAGMEGGEAEPLEETGAEETGMAEDGVAESEAMTDGETEMDAMAEESSADETVADTGEVERAESETTTGDDGMAATEESASAIEDQSDEMTAAPAASQDDTGSTGGGGDSAAPSGPAPESDGDAAPAESQERSAVQELIHQIKTNPLYQYGLAGGGILLLLLLGLLARRKADQEKSFQEELNRDVGDDEQSIALGPEMEISEETPQDDVIAEADGYLEYGRHEQAAEVLEASISEQPSRADLRLKLLEVYADAGNRESFERQMTELNALEDEDASEKARFLEDRLKDAESTPSIDDLESQLRSDTQEAPGAEVAEKAETAEKEDNEALESFDFDETFSSLDTDRAERESEGTESVSDEPLSADATESADAESEETESDTVEFDLSDLELEGAEEQSAESETTEPRESEKAEEEDDYSVDFDLGDTLTEEEGEAPSESSGEESSETEEAEEALDESFLTDLDAELDKVASEESGTGVGKEDESGDELEDLELDISEEDLALMEEVTEDESGEAPSSEASESEAEEEPVASDEPLAEAESLETLEEDETVSSELESEETGSEDEVPSLDESVDDSILEEAEESLSAEQSTTAEESEPEEKPAEEPAGETSEEALDLSGEDLEDDEFDFLEGTDEAATKLDLARAYVEMGDSDGAREILEEVSIEGDEEQKAEAQKLLKSLS